MAHATQTIEMRQAAFRSCRTGAVICTGCFHDISLLPGAEDADLDEWECGFTDAAGRFLDRREAAAAIGVRGSLESRSYFCGDPEPTLEAGHRESFERARRAA